MDIDEGKEVNGEEPLEETGVDLPTLPDGNDEKPGTTELETKRAMMMVLSGR